MTGYNIEELYYLYRQGCPIAQEYLIEYCYWQVTLMLPAYYSHNGLYQSEREDYIQNIVVRCMRALDSYRPDKGMLVKSYLSLVIQRMISSLLVKEQARFIKEKNNCISLDDYYSEDHNVIYLDLVEDNHIAYQPGKQVLYHEQKETVERFINEKCSLFERQVINGHRQGFKDRELAKILKTDIKKIYNANYRIQKKIAKLKSI